MNAVNSRLAVALSLLGQAGFSLFADGTGFLGRRRYGLSTNRVPGIALAAAGTAVLGWGGEIRWAAVPVALAGLPAMPAARAVLDWTVQGVFDLRKFLGTGIVLIGLAVDSRLSRKPAGA